MALHAHASAGLGVQVTGGVILPLQPAGQGIEGIDVGAVVIHDACGHISGAIGDQDTAGRRPGREEFAINRDSTLRRGGAEPPKQFAGSRRKGIDPAVT